MFVVAFRCCLFVVSYLLILRYLIVLLVYCSFVFGFDVFATCCLDLGRLLACVCV